MAIESDDLNRLVAGSVAGVQEEVVERALRPKQLDEYVGQEKIRGQLSIFIEAAKRRRESLDHVFPRVESDQSVAPRRRRTTHHQRVGAQRLGPTSLQPLWQKLQRADLVLPS